MSYGTAALWCALFFVLGVALGFVLDDNLSSMSVVRGSHAEYDCHTFFDANGNKRIACNSEPSHDR